jgi:hypothetical protein
MLERGGQRRKLRQFLQSPTPIILSLPDFAGHARKVKKIKTGTCLLLELGNLRLPHLFTRQVPIRINRVHGAEGRTPTMKLNSAPRNQWEQKVEEG